MHTRSNQTKGDQMNSIPFFTALTLALGELDQPILTRYQIGLTIYRLYSNKKFKNQTINLESVASKTSPDFKKTVENLINSGILLVNRAFPPKTVFNFVGKSKVDPLEIVCALDPFCYISHLSAMEFYGLTDRFSKIIHISSPRQSIWNKYAKDRMNKDLKEEYDNYISIKYPKLTKLNIDKIEGRIVKVFNCIHLGAYKNIKDNNIRVSTIGRTFLNMLQNPELCGGINHVIDCFENHSNEYLKNIIDEIEGNGSKIDKIRAGYILDEICSLNHNIFDEWIKLTQRGGSMKLDSSEEYDPNYSEKWKLSINVYRD